MAKMFEITTENGFYYATAKEIIPKTALPHLTALVDASDCTLTTIAIAPIGEKVKYRKRIISKTKKVLVTLVTAFEDGYDREHARREREKAEEKARLEAEKKALEEAKRLERERKERERQAKPVRAKGNGQKAVNEWIKAHDMCSLEEAKAHGFDGVTKKDLWNRKVDLGLREGKR